MAEAVSMKGITKLFGNFCALDSVDLTVEKGTIHALLGENGAGKSTLMNILYGLYNADSGEIYIDGKKVVIKNPNSAIRLGIGMVHQHFMLVEPLTISQNIILGSEITNGFGVLDMQKAKQEIIAISEKYKLYVDPDAKIEDISVGMQQRVELLKILYRGADILIFDEPTAVLTPQEIAELVNIMRSLAQNNKTIIIITHKLKEIKQASDYCTIIRRGKKIDTVSVAAVDEQALASMMVGRKVNLHVEKKPAAPAEVVFKIEELFVSDSRGIEKVKGLNLEVCRGEIFGIAGIDGSGQKELIEAITNLTKVKGGKIKINEKDIQNHTPKATIKSGIATIHEDRHKRGLILDFSVELNCVIEKFEDKPFSTNHILDFSEIYRYSSNLIEKFDVRPAGCAKLPARALSGGNQQKMIIAREVANNPDLLIAVQPTRGLDVGAIEFVHKSLIAQRDSGKAILLISFELDEILDISDRIGVLYDGKIVTVFEGDEADEQTIGFLMAGGSVNE